LDANTLPIRNSAAGSARKSSRRADPSYPVQTEVWARAAGRCAICNRDLLVNSLTGAPGLFGELAHIAGATVSARSPRGLDPGADPKRSGAGNLMLLCAGDHVEIDRGGSVDLLTIARLRGLKNAHEERIRRYTALGPEQTSVVLRVFGTLRGDAVALTGEAAGAAVVAGDRRFPDYTLSIGYDGVEIDLTGLPGEADPDEVYFASARQRIDEVIKSRVMPAVARGHVHHLAVFAFARLPLLIYLGSQLDDTFPVSVYQHHRATGNWLWQEGGETAAFEVSVPLGEPHNEAALLINVSGSIMTRELPHQVSGLPLYRLTLKEGTPGPEAITTRASLLAFERAVRAFFARIEAEHKDMQRLHVFGALPLAAAVTFGRAHDPHVHPQLVLYDRTSMGYRRALEVG
jgi:hypothetical protein